MKKLQEYLRWIVPFNRVFPQTSESKIVSPNDALSKIRPGDTIFIGTACAEPQLLTLHLSNMESFTDDNTILHSLSLGSAPYVKGQFRSKFRYNSFFITGNIRGAVASGRADYTPVSSKYLPRLFQKKIIPLDVALIQTSMPDESGYVSLGISVDYTKAAAETAELVIAEINPNMPITHGNSFIHISEIDYIVQNEAPILEWRFPEVTPVVERVAKNVATLITDGSTLQFGLGRVPNTVPRYLLDRCDLGIHTEVITDSVLELISCGAVTNRRKTIHTGESVTTFCIGTKKLYDFVNDNPRIKFYPSDYVLDPNIIAQNPKMITINSALEVDLTGQVSADSLGTYLYSGIGGAIDLHRGALRSEGGKAIIALPSTSNDGKHSRIVCTLSKGAGVAITRAETEYIVTEYGIAHLHGATLRERVLDMIELAHPKFRKQLFEDAKKLGYIYEDQVFHDTSTHLLYPLDHQECLTLRNGLEVRLRPIMPSDEDKIRVFFYSLSDKSKFSRYFSAIRSLPHEKAQIEANIDYSKDNSVAAFVGPISTEKIIGTAHAFMLRDEHTAEISLLVSEKYRNLGLARHFLMYLTKRACARGVTHFVSETMLGNKAAIHLLKDFTTNGPARKPKIEKLDDVMVLSWEVYGKFSV
ncbi:MAG: GNAT family N-acetyltransferase [Candidatus Hodarchaeales archaeon]